MPSTLRRKTSAASKNPTWTYIKHFIKDQGVASITPTSAFGVRRLLKQMDFSADRVIVEYGPGTGVISAALLERMTSGSRLLLIERNADFADLLRRRFTDPRVIVREGSAEAARRHMTQAGLKAADYVVSGIPFSLIPAQTRAHLVAQTYAVLKPGGMFLAYQTPWQPDRHLIDHVRRHFQEVDSKFEVRNVPPLRIYTAHKHNGD